MNDSAPDISMTFTGPVRFSRTIRFPQEEHFRLRLRDGQFSPLGGTKDVWVIGVIQERLFTPGARATDPVPVELPSNLIGPRFPRRPQDSISLILTTEDNHPTHPDRYWFQSPPMFAEDQAKLDAMLARYPMPEQASIEFR